jgi:aminoglycoside phosphotransferase (APT) family kinase protein
MKWEPSDGLIRRLLAQVGLGDPGSIRKIGIGFSNHIYSIDDRYILKVGKSEEDDEPLRREIHLCRLLGDRVPAPKIAASGSSDALIGRTFVIYHKIAGENLYGRWHLFDDLQRRDLTRQICGILRSINEAPYRGFVEAFGIDGTQSWCDRMCASINGYLEKTHAQGFLSPEMIAKTRCFLERNADVLRYEKKALTHCDPHFDNLLVSGEEIVGIVDFEGTDVMSIDYVLDLVARMVRQPRKYASEQSEPFVKAEDYAKLLHWYEEFYPEAFAFPDLDRRLAIYAVEHSVEEIFYYPRGEEARRELAGYVG